MTDHRNGEQRTAAWVELAQREGFTAQVEFEQADPDTLKRYVLVEESVYDKSYYVTDYDQPADAAEYHDSQEYPEDWVIVGLFDLDAGIKYRAETTTSFVMDPTVENGGVGTPD